MTRCFLHTTDDCVTVQQNINEMTVNKKNIPLIASNDSIFMCVRLHEYGIGLI